MNELRLSGKSADGAYLTLTDNDGIDFSLRISDMLRATINQPRLAAVRTPDGESISVKEIQARLRAGEAIENIARDANWTIEKVERFAGPIQQERAYIISQAQEIILRRESGREPLTFLEVIISRLAPRNVDVNSFDWNCWRLEDASWVIRLGFPNRDGIGSAEWNFDMTRKAIAPLDDSARWLTGDDSALKERQSSDHGLIYGNHPAARLPLQNRPIETHDAPRLVSIRELPDDEAARDGVTGRAKVPSWDEIMFGSSKKESEDFEE